MRTHWLTGFSILALTTLTAAHNGHEATHAGADTAQATQHTAAADTADSPELVTVKGEVLDLACYLDHGAQGPGHADCARTCVASGLPVGLKDESGKVYLLIGEHKPINKTLTPYAAKTITVRGKAVSRDGINLLENAEIVR